MGNREMPDLLREGCTMSEQTNQGDRPDRREWMAATAAAMALVNDTAPQPQRPSARW
jgi:hypothetical protein